jgi:hypothetical protein
MVVLRIIADENVHEDIIEFLLERGHDVVRARDKFGEGTPDHIIARVADELHAIIMISDNHFRRLSGWSSRSASTRYPHMGLIIIPGDATAPLLVSTYLEDIEANYERAQSFEDQRLLIDISVSGFFVRRTVPTRQGQAPD